MRYSDSDGEWYDSPPRSGDYCASSDSYDDGAPTLPGIVLREQAQNGATIVGAIILIELACALGKGLMALLPPLITPALPAAAASHPATKATTATPLGTPPLSTNVPGGGPVVTDTPITTDTPVTNADTDTPVPVRQSPPATNTPQPKPTATPMLTAISPTPLRINLLINPGFEGNGGWAVSAHSFNETGGHTSSVRHAHWDPSASYSAYTKQTVENLTSGVYQATAWIESSYTTTGNYFVIIDAANGNQLASYNIPSCLQNAWVQITL